MVLKSYFGEDLMNDNKKKKNGYRLEKKEIIKQIAKDRNTNKNEIYQKFLKK